MPAKLAQHWKLYLLHALGYSIFAVNAPCMATKRA